MYDGLLNLSLPTKVTLVAYFDDMALVIAKPRENIEVKFYKIVRLKQSRTLLSTASMSVLTYGIRFWRIR